MQQHPPALRSPPPRLSQVLTRAGDSAPAPFPLWYPATPPPQEAGEGGAGEEGVTEGRKVAGPSALRSTRKTRPADPLGGKVAVRTQSYSYPHTHTPPLPWRPAQP